MNRREFLRIGGTAAGMAVLAHNSSAAWPRRGKPFKISLAEWSLHHALEAGKMSNLDFPKLARREFKIECVEYVDQFFADKSKDRAYLSELKSRSDGEGVACHLIMLDTNGALGAAAKKDRDLAVEKTFAWIEASKFLGGSAVRVNAYGEGNADELRARVAESCARLADFAAERHMKVMIENHGGLSSDAAWLTSLMRTVNKPNFGTLPDFGNFDPGTNRYDAVEMMMPFAKAVSAKAERFTAEGEVVETDFRRMMRIVRDGGYQGWLGVETEPPSGDLEYAAIHNTRRLLETIFEEQARVKPIFNGKDLSGWKKIEGGEWAVEDGVLFGHHGIHWSTNPEKTGSWLSTRKQYRDFRLELQFMVNTGGNSGVFFRSSHERNPAFTGYEMQIHDSPGRPPRWPRLALRSGGSRAQLDPRRRPLEQRHHCCPRQ
jgi:L-ribulose-5-phosphate 3-epimerase